MARKRDNDRPVKDASQGGVHQPHRAPLDPEWSEPIPADVPAEPFENRRKWINREPGGVLAYRRQRVYWHRQDQARTSRRQKYDMLGITDVAKRHGLEEDEVFEGLRVILVGRPAPHMRLPIDPWGRRSPRAHWTPFTMTVRPKDGIASENKPAVTDNQLLNYWLRRGEGRRYWFSTPRAWHAWSPDEWLADAVWFDLDDHDGRGHILRRYLAIVGALGPPAFVASSSTRPEIEIPARPADFHGIQAAYDLDRPTPLSEIRALAQRLKDLLEQHEPQADAGGGRLLRPKKLIEVFPMSPGTSLRVCLGVDSYVLDPQTLVPIADGPPNALGEIFEQWFRYYRHNNGPPTIQTLLDRLKDALESAGPFDGKEEASPSRSTIRVEVRDEPDGQEDDESWTGKGRYFWEHGLPGEDTRVEYVKAALFFEYTNVDGAHTEEEMFEKVYDRFSTGHHGYSTLWNRSPQEFAHWLRATIREEFQWYEEKAIEPWRRGRPALYPSRNNIERMVELVEYSSTLTKRERLPTLRFLYALAQYVVYKHRGDITEPFTVPIPQKTLVGLPCCTKNSRVNTYVGKRIEWLIGEGIIERPPGQYKLYRNGFHQCFKYVWLLPLSANDYEVGVSEFLRQLPDSRLDELFGQNHRVHIKAAAEQT